MTPKPDAEGGRARAREIVEIVGVFALIAVFTILVLVILGGQTEEILSNISGPV